MNGYVQVGEDELGNPVYSDGAGRKFVDYQRTVSTPKQLPGWDDVTSFVSGLPQKIADTSFADVGNFLAGIPLEVADQIEGAMGDPTGKSAARLAADLGVGTGAVAATKTGGKALNYDPDVASIFLGGGTASKEMADRALKMELDGATPDEIFQATIDPRRQVSGLWRDNDNPGRWNVEVPTNIVGPSQELENWAGQYNLSTLEGMLDPAFTKSAFAQYMPDVADIITTMLPPDPAQKGLRGTYQRGNGLKTEEISLYGTDPEVMLGTAVHEGQHGIDQRLGRSGGSSPKRAQRAYAWPMNQALNDLATYGNSRVGGMDRRRRDDFTNLYDETMRLYNELGDINGMPFDLYLQDTGEARARGAASRKYYGFDDIVNDPFYKSDSYENSIPLEYQTPSNVPTMRGLMYHSPQHETLQNFDLFNTSRQPLEDRIKQYLDKLEADRGN